MAKKYFGLYIEEDLIKKAKHKAVERGLSNSGLFEELIKELK